MDLGPALFPVAPELGVMLRRASSLVWERLRDPSLVCERLRGPSLVWERLRVPSRDVTLEPEAVRDRMRRVMLAEGTGNKEDNMVRIQEASTGVGLYPCLPAMTVYPTCPAEHYFSIVFILGAIHLLCHSQRR